MPPRELPMKKVRDLIRLKYETRLSHEQIARALSISKGVVAKYVGRVEARGLDPARRAALTGFPRQALHAALLGFRHPVTGAALRFESPMPADMAALVALFGDQPG